MDLKQIEKYCENGARKIVDIIVSEHDVTDFEINSLNIEKEVFEICSNYASIFIFENNLLLSDKVKNSLILTMKSRFDISDRKANKMSKNDLISHLLKLSVIDYLSDRYNLGFI